MDVLIELAVEEQESFTLLRGFESGMTRTDSGSSHKAGDLCDRGDGDGIFGEDSNAITTEVRDQNVFVLWVDEDVVRIAPILA